MGYILGHNLSLWINLKPIQRLIMVYLYSCIIHNSFLFLTLRLELHTFYVLLYFSSIYHIFKLDIKKSDHVSIWNFYYKFLIIKSWYIDFTNATINQCIWIYIKRSIFRCVFLQNKIPCVKFSNLTLFFRLKDDLLNDSKSSYTSSYCKV